MNYWIITTEYPPFHGGGISTYNFHTAQMLNENKHNVTIFVNDDSINSLEEVSFEKGIRVIRFRTGSEPFYNYLGYSAALSYQFSQILINKIKSGEKPDYIETQDYHAIGYYLILRKKLGENVLKNIPIILTAHAPSFYYLKHSQAPAYKLPDFWMGEMEKWVLKAADILISPSHFLIDEIKDTLNEAYKTYRIVRNPYRTLEYEIDTRKQNKKDIVFFGKLTYQKGCIHLLKYLSQLWNEGFEHKLIFIGGDHFFDAGQINMQDYLIKKFRKFYDKGLFTFEGKINPEQIRERFTDVYMTIIPSVVDNFPYAVVEAMSEGRLLLISDGGGQREMIKANVNGFIYRHNDTSSFSEQINLALSLSQEEYSSITSKAKEDIHAMCNYAEVYSQKIAVLEDYCKSSHITEFPFIREIKKSEHTSQKTFKEKMLTVVVPYYNTGKYLAETLESIFSTDYPSKQVIVINDGSDDNESIAVLAKLHQKYNFELINKQNAGLAEARNTGCDFAKGEFITFLDADDKVHPNLYKKSIDILNSYQNISFVSSWVQYFGDSDGIWPAQNPEPPLLLLHNMVNAGFVCRTADYSQYAKNDPTFEYGMEDYDANISLLENGCRGVVIPEPLYYYRIHSQSMARSFNKNNKLYLYNLLSSKHRLIYQQYSEEVFNLLLSNGPSYLYDNPTFEPATDILEMRKWIKELENANGWYDRTLKHYQSVVEKNNIQVDQLEAMPDNSNFEDRYHELKHWYHKEYEVLPLWYKRIGHVVKVLQGKRKFKSLFIKNSV